MLPLICYEVIFPAEAVPPGERPGWLLNLTNDAWFGISSGPYQHFQQARVRAIEEGLPLVRAANDGISAVIDPVGRVVAALALGREGVLNSGLPTPIAPTIYTITREFIILRYRCRRDGFRCAEAHEVEVLKKSRKNRKGVCELRVPRLNCLTIFSFRHSAICGLGREALAG